MRRRITADEINTFIKKHGIKGKEAVETLARTDAFAEAFESEIFQENVVDAIASLQHLLEKIWNETADDVDRADFRALKRLISTWQRRYASRNAALEQIVGGL